LSYKISEMAEILNIEGEPIFDDRVDKIETHTYNPYANTFGQWRNRDTRITAGLIHFTLWKFSLCRKKIDGKEKKQRIATMLGNNCVAFMFDEIRYKFNGVEIN